MSLVSVSPGVFELRARKPGQAIAPVVPRARAPPPAVAVVAVGATTNNAAFALKRLQQDLKEVTRCPLASVAAHPTDDLFTWHANVMPPVGHSLAGIPLHLELLFTEQYPRVPPTVSVFTELWHNNIFQGGRQICMDMLEQGEWSSEMQKNTMYTGWSTAYSVQSILVQLQAFFFDEERLYGGEEGVRAAIESAASFTCSCGHSMERPVPLPLAEAAEALPLRVIPQEYFAAPTSMRVPRPVGGESGTMPSVHAPVLLTNLETGSTASVTSDETCVTVASEAKSALEPTGSIPAAPLKPRRGRSTLDSIFAQYAAVPKRKRNRAPAKVIEKTAEATGRSIEDLAYEEKLVGTVIKTVPHGVILEVGVHGRGRSVDALLRFSDAAEGRDGSWKPGQLVTVWVADIDYAAASLKVTQHNPLGGRGKPVTTLYSGQVLEGVVLAHKGGAAVVDVGITKTRRDGGGSMFGEISVAELSNICGEVVWEASSLLPMGTELSVKVVSASPRALTLRPSSRWVCPTAHKMSPEGTATRLDPSAALACSPFDQLSDELLLIIFAYLGRRDLEAVSSVCALFQRLAMEHLSRCHLAYDLVCFHSKASFTDDILGFPVTPEWASNAWLADITSPLDVLSYRAFAGEAVRRSVWKEQFSHWLPLCITPAHEATALPLAERAISAIARGVDSSHFVACLETSFNPFEPCQVLQVLPKLMNTIVVSVMSGEVHESIRALHGYYGVLHLFLAFAKKYPTLQADVERRLEEFVSSPAKRSKRHVASLGELVVLLALSDTHTWQSVALPFLEEAFTRNVKWALKEHAVLANPSLPPEFRRGLTLHANIVSLRLMMFHVCFMRLARPAGSTSTFTKRSLDFTFGLPTPAVEARLQQEVKDIKDTTTWSEFFERLSLPTPSDEYIGDWLLRSLAASEKCRYHRANDYNRKAKLPKGTTLESILYPEEPEPACDPTPAPPAITVVHRPAATAVPVAASPPLTTPTSPPASRPSEGGTVGAAPQKKKRIAAPSSASRKSSKQPQAVAPPERTVKKLPTARDLGVSRQMASLINMGFVDLDKNQRALQRYNNDIARAMDYILSSYH